MRSTCLLIDSLIYLYVLSYTFMCSHILYLSIAPLICVLHVLSHTLIYSHTITLSTNPFICVPYVLVYALSYTLMCSHILYFSIAPLKCVLHALSYTLIYSPCHLLLSYVFDMSLQLQNPTIPFISDFSSASIMLKLFNIKLSQIFSLSSIRGFITLLRSDSVHVYLKPQEPQPSRFMDTTGA